MKHKKININNIKAKMNKRSIKNMEVILFVMIALLTGILIGETFTHTNVASKSAKLNDKNLNKFIYNYEYILNNYYKKLDPDELINSAIKGMTESLDDPYSVYMDETESNNFSITLDGSYKGLGLQIGKDEQSGYMIVTGILKNSPATKVDIKVGDKIVSINDKLSKDMKSSDFSSYVTSSKEDNFVLKLIRGDEEKTVTLKKDSIVLTSVTSKVYEVNNKKIGYIYIGIFANNTYVQFKNALEDLESKNIDSLIIDVRSNSGGHLTAVDNILDMFLNSKQIMYQFKQSGKVKATYGTGNENKKKYEIVLLADSNSASASEVLIAGLKDNFGYKLIGQKTYGKGSVQEMVNLSDGSQYKITTKKWLTPNSKCLTDDGGIIPDIEVKLDDKYYDTYEEKDDNQLQTAIDYLSK